MKCTYECLREKTCKSINYNEEVEKCELLEISKFDHPQGLKRALKWKHYETDDDVKNVRNKFFILRDRRQIVANLAD